MESHQQIGHMGVRRTGYADTARHLLDSLIIYRAELGVTGRQLERLLRERGISASTDLPAPKRQQ